MKRGELEEIARAKALRQKDGDMLKCLKEGHWGGEGGKLKQSEGKEWYDKG